MWKAFLILLMACGGGSAPTPVDHDHDHDHDHDGAQAKEAAPELGESEQPGQRIAASVLLVGYEGVDYAGLGTPPTRTKQEARVLAERLAREAQADPERFADLAQEHSDHETARQGGMSPSFEADTLHGPLAVLKTLEVGQVGDPLDWTYGYLILKREPILSKQMVSARRLVVAWDGAQRAPGSVTRSREEARIRALELRKRAVADPEGFEALIRSDSDGFDRDRGGYLGSWRVETRRVPVHYEAAITGLEIGGISEPVESELGFELFQRLAVTQPPRQLAASHILVSWSGAEKSRSRRSRADARARAEELADLAQSDPKVFATLAVEHSEDGTASKGGQLGAWRVGSRMPEDFDQGVSKIAVGEIGVVESPFGFHVVLREKAPEDLGREYRTPGEETQYYE